MLRRRTLLMSATLVIASLGGQALALPAEESGRIYWQCVPIARMLSGIEIRGDAHTWWGQAAGRYDRGKEPKRGSVLAFKPVGSMRLGHVAAVSKVIDDRTILVTHSNWSRINGTRGQIERNVRVIDASENNDWSRVRVWYAPLQDLGTTVYPVHGFIYPEGKAPMQMPGNAAPMPQPKFSDQVRVVDAPREIKPTGRIAYLGKVLKGLN